jgi:4-diphosphocytidyl-2-C-methyl-D-erythritol kinase
MAERETAYAKINLALHVRSRGADGYHQLETLFAFAESGDELSLEAGTGLSLVATGPFGSALGVTDDNLVLRAARAFCEELSAPSDITFHLQKNLPIASGIGGGSADAAAALRLLCRHHDVDPADEPVARIARKLGADVPACLASLVSRGEGRGDDLRPLPAEALRSMPLLLVNPRVPLATGAVFARWDRIDRGGLGLGDPLEAALAGRNDLEPPARSLVPVIGELLDLLAAQSGVLLSRMSGSGATCFALFESEVARDEASAVIAAARPDWWRLATRLR